MTDPDCPLCAFARAPSAWTLRGVGDRDVTGVVPLDPVTPGHVLLLPRRHVPYLWELRTLEFVTLTLAVRATIEVLRGAHPDVTGVNVLHASGRDAQQSVEHVHVHVIPRRPNDGLDAWLRRAEENP